MSQPLVTIVTPSFNQGRFIRQTIESVLNQDYPNIEYIIMDNGSRDETAAIALEYASRLTFVPEQDRGQSHAINNGFRRGRGEILSWLNSDDILLPGAVSAAVRAFQEMPRVGAVYGDGFTMDLDGQFSARFPYTQKFNLYRLANISDYILQQTVFLRRAVLVEVGYLREDLHFTLDWELWIRIGKRYPLHYVPAYFGAIREHGDAKSSAGGIRRIREIRDMLREHTGRWLPPGWTLYGMDTLARWCCQSIGRWPGRLADFGKLLAWFLCGALAYAAVDWDQDWFHDTWAGRDLRYWLPRGEGRLVLEGFMPAHPNLLGQRIRISGNGRLLADIEVPPGRFRHKIPISSSEGHLHLGIRASHTHILNVRDARRLSYVLERIRWNGYEYGPPLPRDQMYGQIWSSASRNPSTSPSSL